MESVEISHAPESLLHSVIISVVCVPLASMQSSSLRVLPVVLSMIVASSPILIIVVYEKLSCYKPCICTILVGARSALRLASQCCVAVVLHCCKRSGTL